MQKNLSEGTMVLARPVYVRGKGSAVGQEEAKGPLGKYFDLYAEDAKWGEKTFEFAEKKFFLSACKRAIEDAGLSTGEVDLLLGGDLLNQIITASYSARDLGIPFLGVYGACSGMAESLAAASMLLDGGFGRNILCAASSHFATAERQFRFPLELGTPKPPTGQDTVTGAGATVLSTEGPGRVAVRALTIGRCVDYGIADANNMGAAMAPAAVQSILTHLENRGATPRDYDAIFTGDLGIFGSRLFVEMARQCGAELAGVHKDCGSMIYAGMKNKRCGASGCGCCAVVLNGFILRQLEKGVYRRVLFAATGAMMSTTSVQQGESIPGIAHVVELERVDG